MPHFTVHIFHSSGSCWKMEKEGFSQLRCLKGLWVNLKPKLRRASKQEKRAKNEASPKALFTLFPLTTHWSEQVPCTWVLLWPGGEDSDGEKSAECSSERAICECVSMNSERLTHSLIMHISLPQKGFVHWLKINFSELFAAWIHLKALRVFVESALRYVLNC